MAMTAQGLMLSLAGVSVAPMMAFHARSKRAKRKLKNYKLKHSRLLTFYSALLCLLYTFERKGTVSRFDALEMIERTPTQRLEWLLGESGAASARDQLGNLLDRYERFLETTNASESELVTTFMDADRSRDHMTEAYGFGDAMFEAFGRVGDDSRFHRLLVV